MNKKISKYLTFTCITFFLLTNITNAAVSSKIHFCEYPGTLRALKIVGIVIILLKIAAPLILTYSGISDLVKVVISGKQEDLTGTAVKLFKKIIAGLIIFVIPSIVNYAFTELIEVDNSSFDNCTTCIFNIGECTIPETDPDIQIPDDDTNNK